MSSLPARAVDEQPVVAPGAHAGPGPALAALAAYLGIGFFFGVVLTKAEIVTWYRIEEMFRFQSFHMYGVLGSAVAVSALAMTLIRKLGLRSWDGQPIVVPPKEMRPPATRYWLGGSIFGLGWGLLGACPGPIYALLGAGVTVLVVSLLSALVGTWVYAALRSRLPH